MVKLNGTRTITLSKCILEHIVGQANRFTGIKTDRQKEGTHSPVLFGEEVGSVVQPFLLQRHKHTVILTAARAERNYCKCISRCGPPPRWKNYTKTRKRARKRKNPPSWLRTAGDRKWTQLPNLVRRKKNYGNVRKHRGR